MVGCWQLDDRSWAPLTVDQVERALDTYLALGINQFDTADIYGRSERLLGQLLAGRDCLVYTKAIFLEENPTPAQVRSKVEASLRNLHRDRLDCVQVHWHHPHLDFASTFAVFQDLLDQGKIRRLGVTNFNTPMLAKALQYANISSHQVQYSLIDRRVELSMQALCLQHQIGLLTYGSLAGGYLSDTFCGVAAPKVEADHARRFLLQQHDPIPMGVGRGCRSFLGRCCKLHENTKNQFPRWRSTG